LARLSKRADILKAGVELLHKRGYAGSPVDSIVEAAGVPKGSFFNHFHSKEAFAAEVLDSYFLPWTEKSEAVLNRVDISAQKKLLELITIATRKARGSYEGCLVGNMSLELAHQSEPLRLQLAKVLDVWSGSFERVLREGQLDGSLHCALPPDKMARFIVNLFQGAVLRAKVEHSNRATKEFKDIVLTVLGARAH